MSQSVPAAEPVYVMLDGMRYRQIEDILLPAQGDSRDAMKNKTYTWPDNTVYYQFEQVSPAARKAVLDAIKLLEKKTALHFVPRIDQPNFIRIKSYTDPQGVSCGRSIIGMQLNSANGQELRINDLDFCLNGRTALHELMHALGFEHEHLRADRDRYITYNAGMPAAIATLVSQRPYDVTSIMHYSPASYAIRPIDPGIPLSSVGGKTLSSGDIAVLNRLYPQDPWESSGAGNPMRMAHYANGNMACLDGGGVTTCKSDQPTQRWLLDAGRLVFAADPDQCLTVAEAEEDVYLARCDGSDRQRWRKWGTYWLNKTKNNQALSVYRNTPVMVPFREDKLDQQWAWVH
jgi:hypothetical protein